MTVVGHKTNHLS